MDKAIKSLEYIEATINNAHIYSWFVCELINIYNDSICYEYQLYIGDENKKLYMDGEHNMLREAINRAKEILRGFVLSLVSGGMNIPSSNFNQLNQAFNDVWEFHITEGKMRGYMQAEKQSKKEELIV